MNANFTEEADDCEPDEAALKPNEILLKWEDEPDECHDDPVREYRELKALLVQHFRTEHLTTLVSYIPQPR